jgi:hypothetical protein
MIRLCFHRWALLALLSALLLGGALVGNVPSPRDTLAGHIDSVVAVAFSNDGKLLASAARDGVIAIWDVATGKQKHLLRGHTDGITALAFSRDSKLLASAGLDRMVRLWDPASGTVVAVLRGHTDGVNSVAFAPDGKTLASGGSDKVVRLWDLAKLKEITQLSGDRFATTAVAYNGDGTILAEGSHSGAVRLWDVKTRKVKKTLRQPFWVHSLAFAPDGKTIVIASGSLLGDSKVFDLQLWDVATGKVRADLKGHTSVVGSVAFSADSKRVASASFDTTARVWDAGTGKVITVLSGHGRGVLAVAFAPDGNSVVTGSLDRTVCLWPIGREKPVRASVRGQEGRVSGGGNSPDSKPVRAAGPPLSLAEKFLHDGKFAEGETASLLALDANPKNDEVRFGLGVIQFVRAVDNLGKALYEYGAVSEKANQPFLRLPVPRNRKPSAISYKALGRVLDVFATDLGRAEATLAGIKDDKVKLRLRLARITFDFAGTGKDRTTLLDLLTRLNGRRLHFQKANPDFRVHFDRGDVAWLRAYCRLLSAMVEGYRAVDLEGGFQERVEEVFPKVEAPARKVKEDWNGLKVVDAPRLRRMRLHLVAVCELNRETWEHIRKETDDDYEWLPHPKQTDHLGLPLTDERIDGWLAMMKQWEGLLKGERLVSGDLLRSAGLDIKEGQGLNLKKLLDDPPADRMNLKWVPDARYLEQEKGKQVLDWRAMDAMGQLFDGPFGFAYAARLN